LAHLIGDFLLQPGSWVQDKKSKKIRSVKLYIHALIHGLLVLLVLWDVKYWLLALVIMITHYAIDLLKLYQQKSTTKISWFWTDQILHLISLVVFYWIWFQPNWHLVQEISDTFWIYATSVVFITVVTGVIIQVLMQQWSQEINDSSNQSLKNAGKFIGILERIFIYIFVVSGHWAPIGFLLAAKSIFRFGDLKEARDRKLTEYILIGTLLSFGIAISTGIVVRYLISVVRI
jgi:hypothetical protein